MSQSEDLINERLDRRYGRRRRLLRGREHPLVDPRMQTAPDDSDLTDRDAGIYGQKSDVPPAPKYREPPSLKPTESMTLTPATDTLKSRRLEKPSASILTEPTIHLAHGRKPQEEPQPTTYQELRKRMEADGFVLKAAKEDARSKVLRIARRAQVPDDIAEDFLNVTGGIESGNSHYWKNGKVKESPRDPKDGQVAVGFSQIKPGTIKQYNLDPYDEEQNIEGGLRYFAEGGSDPVARRLRYFGGPKGGVQSYQRTGTIPKGGDFTGTSYDKYVKATMPKGQQAPAKGNAASIIEDMRRDFASVPTTTPETTASPVQPAGQKAVPSNQRQVVRQLRRRQPVQPQQTQFEKDWVDPQPNERALAQARAMNEYGGRVLANDVVAKSSALSSVFNPQKPANTPDITARIPAPVLERGGKSLEFAPNVGNQIMRDRANAQSHMKADFEAAKQNVTGFTLNPITNLRNLVGIATGGTAYLQNEVANEEESIRAQRERSQTPEMAGIRKEYGAMSTPVRSVMAPLQESNAGFLRAIGGLTSLAGLAPNRLSDWANKRGQIIQEGASLAPLNDVGEEIQRKLPEKIASAFAQTGLSIAEIVLLKDATGLSLDKLLPLETALKTSDQPMHKRAPQIAESALMGRMLQREMSKPVSALLFGAPTAAREGQSYVQGHTTLEDAILNTAIQTGIGGALGGKKGTVPERPETRAIQLESFRDGDRPFVILDKGEVKPILEQNEGIIRANVDGEPRDVVYNKDNHRASQVRKMAVTGELTRRLGYDKEGHGQTGVAASATVGGTEAAVLQEQFPDAQIEVKPIEQIKAERVLPDQLTGDEIATGSKEQIERYEGQERRGKEIQAANLGRRSGDTKSAFDAIVGESQQEQPQAQASVAFMITRKMEADLKSQGYSQADIDKMKPQEAQDILSAKSQESQPVAQERGEPTTPVLREPQSRADFRVGFLRDQRTIGRDDPRWEQGKAISGIPDTRARTVWQKNLAEILPANATSLYHETSLDNARRLIPRLESVNARSHSIDVSDNVDLALGQSGKGIIIEFDPALVNGTDRTASKPMLGAVKETGGGSEYRIGSTVVGSVKAIIAKTQRQVDALRKIRGLDKRFDFDAAETVERGIRIPRKTRPSEVAQPAQTEKPVTPKQVKQESVNAAKNLSVPPAEIETRSEVEKPREPKIQPLPANIANRQAKSVITERGTRADAVPATIDASDIITSLDEGYPQSLQPRDRSRKASKEQISTIANTLEPELLGDSPQASTGRPLVIPIEIDGKTKYAVVSGNGRVAALRQNYESKSDRATKYAEFANSQVEGESAKQPVYVGVLKSEGLDLAKFASEANEQSTAAMSASEQGMADAKVLDAGLMSQFQPSESGEIANTANRAFIRSFIDKAVAPAERGRYLDREGHLSQEGIARIRNAVFAKAYGDVSALERMAESSDNNVRNITQVLIRNAAQFASLKQAVANGVRYPLDISGDMAKAMQKLATLREESTSVADYIKQGNLFGADLSPIQQRILQVFDQNKRSVKSINTVLDYYLRGAEQAGNPKQGGMFGAQEKVSPDQLFEAAVQQYESAAKAQPDLFANQGASTESDTRSEVSAVDTNAPSPEPHHSQFQNRAKYNTPNQKAGDFKSGTIEAAPRGETPKASPVEAPKEPAILSKLETAANAARERLKARGVLQTEAIAKGGKEAGSSPIPEDLTDYAIIGAHKIAKGAVDFAKWSKEMVSEFGDGIREHLDKIYAMAQDFHNKELPAKTTGIAQRVEEARRQEPAPRGEGISAEASVERGRQLLREGRNPQDVVEEFKKTGAISSDAMAVVRARHEELAKEANAAFDKGGQKVNDPAFQAAEKNRQDWWERGVKPLQTEWAKTGMAQQGETAIDTGTFYGLYRAFKDKTGREMTPSEQAIAKRLTSKVAQSEIGVQDAQKQLVKLLDNATGIKELPADIQKSLKKFISESQRESRTAVRRQTRKTLDDQAVVIKQNLAAAFKKINTQTGAQPSGLARLDPEGEITKLLIDYAKNRVKAGVTDAAQLIDDAHATIKEFADVSRREVAEALAGMGAQKRERKTSDWATVKSAVKTGLKAEDTAQTWDALKERAKTGKVSPADAKVIWEHTREKYIDKGVEFGDAMQAVAKELGVKPELVRRALANQPQARRLTDEAYKRMSDRRQARQAAENWVRNADRSPGVRALQGLSDAFFNLKTFGHGTVGPLTHAGENIFHPTRWVPYLRNMGRTWKAAYSSASHERYIQDLISDPNYLTARRAGLANEPGKFYDEYQNTQMQKMFGTIGKIGNRGFDILKTMRQDFFNSRWNKLSEDQKTPEMAKMIADLTNHATGAIRTQLPYPNLVRGVFFAAPLEASRWARIIGDPIRALDTLVNLKRSTPAQRYFAKSVVKNHAEFLGVYLAALAMNQGILLATGSKDRVNFTDPKKGDWLRLKVKGRAIEPTGGLISTLDFLGKLGQAAIGPQDPRQGRFERMGRAGAQYFRGKLSPFASTVADVATQSDFTGRPLPFSSDKGTLEKPSYSWPEYLLVQQSPIPVAEAMRDVFTTMRSQGVPVSTTKDIISGIMAHPSALAKGMAIGTLSGGTGVRIGEQIEPRSTAKADRQAEVSKIRDGLVSQIRGGANKDAELKQLVQDGKLTASEAKEVTKDAKLTEIQYEYKKMLLSDEDRAARLLQTLTPAQQQSVQSVKEDVEASKKDKTTRESQQREDYLDTEQEEEEKVLGSGGIASGILAVKRLAGDPKQGLAKQKLYSRAIRKKDKGTLTDQEMHDLLEVGVDVRKAALPQKQQKSQPRRVTLREGARVQ